MESISGEVWYRERMMLPPGAEITVALQDVSRADAPAVDIGSTRLTAASGPPFPFTIDYDPMRIVPQGRYVLRARIESGGQLLFTNTESIPAFDRSGDAPIRVLVSRVARGTPAPPDAAVRLLDTEWQLAEIRGHPAGTGAGQKPVTLTLTRDGLRAAGFSGCNRYSGSYQLKGDQLHFSQMAGTRMACLEGMELEQKYLEALPQTVRFTMSGGELALYSGADNLILRFVAAGS